MPRATVWPAVVLGLCDAALSGALLCLARGGDPRHGGFTFAALTGFRTDALDLVALFVLRLLLFPLMGYVAVRLGGGLQSAPTSPTHSDGYSPVPREDPEDPIATDLQNQERREREQWRRNVITAALFVIISGLSVYTGLKSVTFVYDYEWAQGPVMIALVLCINLEFYAAKHIVGRLTDEEGHMVPGLHGHPLFLAPVARRKCMLCGQRVQRQAYQCRECASFICMACFRKGNRHAGEGLLRTDKGIHEEVQVSNLGYFWQALLISRPFFHIVLLAFGCLLINQGTRILLPKTQGAILDSVIQGDHDAFVRSIQLFLIYSVSTGFFGAIRSLCVDICGRRMSTEVANRLFASLIVQDIAFFDGNSTGQLTSRMTNDVTQMVNPMRTLLNTLLSNVLLLGGGLVMCFFTSWRLSMVAFTSMGPIVYATQLYARWSRSINREIYDDVAKANTIATEAFVNIRTVRAFSMEDAEKTKYLQATLDALQRGMRDAVVGAGAYAFTNYVDLGAGVLVLWYGGSVVMRKEGLSVGNLITFQLYWNMLNDAWRGLNDIVNSFTRAAGAAQRVISLMELKPDIDSAFGEKLEEVKGEVRIEAIDFVYQMRPDTKVLDNLSLTIAPNTMCALVGRSGGGKSTIVHLLMRFYDPSAGRITLDGHDYCNLNVRWLHDHMGLVAQDTQLFGSTIEENITYGLPGYDHEQMIAAAKLANAHEFITRFEDGYLTRVGERGVRLSGGQKQRIAIARVLLRRPKLLLLDEATSALDTESEGLVQQSIDRLIQTLQGGCTVVVIAHRLSTVMNADKIAVIDGGKVAEEGTHEDLLARHGVYHTLVTRQLQKGKDTVSDNDGMSAAFDTLLGGHGNGSPLAPPSPVETTTAFGSTGATPTQTPT